MYFLLFKDKQEAYNEMYIIKGTQTFTSPSPRSNLKLIPMCYFNLMRKVILFHNDFKFRPQEITRILSLTRR